MAAAEEIHAPMPSNILAGPVNPAIAFRVPAVLLKGILPPIFEFAMPGRSRRDAGDTISSTETCQLWPDVKAGAG